MLYRRAPGLVASVTGQALGQLLSSRTATKASWRCLFESMRHFGKRSVRLLSGLLLSLSTALLVSDAAGNPYGVIAGSNVFRLRPPPRQDAASPPVMIPTVTPVGITTMLTKKLALLKVSFPARPPEPAKEVYCILSVGQREGPIEVVAIDEIVRSVKVNNSGTIMVLSLDQDSPRQAPSPMPPGPRPQPPQ
jgi:hypothetical protein